MTELARHQSLGAFRAGARVRFRAPVWTRSRVSAINGAEGRIEDVEVTSLDSGRVRTVACDLVVFTADWIPDHELAVLAGIELDPGTRGPRVDGAMRTPLPGVFATGNLVHPAETADSCALGGRHAAAAVSEFLGGEADWPSEHVRVLAGEGLRWVVPGLLAAGEPAVAARPLPAAPPRHSCARRSCEVVPGRADASGAAGCRA